VTTDRNLTDIIDATPPTETSDPGLDAGLAAAFGLDLTPGGWSQPPLLVDDPAEDSAVVYPASPEMPREKTERYHFLGEDAAKLHHEYATARAEFRRE
jgi:hypothetical protein